MALWSLCAPSWGHQRRGAKGRQGCGMGAAEPVTTSGGSVKGSASCRRQEEDQEEEEEEEEGCQWRLQLLAGSLRSEV